MWHFFYLMLVKLFFALSWYLFELEEALPERLRLKPEEWLRFDTIHLPTSSIDILANTSITRCSSELNSAKLLIFLSLKIAVAFSGYHIAFVRASPTLH